MDVTRFKKKRTSIQAMNTHCESGLFHLITFIFFYYKTLEASLQLQCIVNKTYKVANFFIK